MSHIAFLTKKTLNKIFVNLSKDLNEDVSRVQLAISYAGGKQKYEAYKNLKKEKEIDISGYMGKLIDLSGGTEIINLTIANAGPAFAKEYGCPLEDIDIVMQYNKGEMPMAVLRVKQEKKRRIDIEKEFLSIAA